MISCYEIESVLYLFCKLFDISLDLYSDFISSTYSSINYLPFDCIS